MPDVDTHELEKAFTRFLLQRRDHLMELEKLWLAWKAGTEWTMAEIRKQAGLPPEKPD